MTGPREPRSSETGTGTGTGPADPRPAEARGAGAPTGVGPDPLVVRPRLLLVTAWVAAAVIVVIFAVVAYLLPQSDTGVYFRVADQVSIMIIGVLIALGLLSMARPRVRADERGIEVRNIAASRWFPWSEVEGVAFPDGTSWARLDLPDDEYHPVLAVQAADRQRAVDGIRRLRALHQTAHETS